MAQSLFHIVTGLQHEVQDGTGSEPLIALPPLNRGTIHCINAHQVGVQLRRFKKKAGGINVESVFLLFGGSTYHSLSHRDVLHPLSQVRNRIGHGLWGS